MSDLKEKQWKRVADGHIRHIWLRAKDDDCQETCPYPDSDPCIVRVFPDWYEHNGTPICCCGDDMEYSHTEVLVEEQDRPSHWDEIPGYPVEDWRYEVMNDDTRLGYSEWVEHQREWERFENENQLKEESK